MQTRRENKSVFTLSLIHQNKGNLLAFQGFMLRGKLLLDFVVVFQGLSCMFPQHILCSGCPESSKTHSGPTWHCWGWTGDKATPVPGAAALEREISSLETQCQQQLPHTEFPCQGKGCLKAPQDIEIVIDFSLFGAQSLPKSA